VIEAGADIESVIAEYAAAVLAKEPARVAALYAPDVRVFDTWGVWSYDDRDAWGRTLEQWLGSLGNERVQVQFNDVCLVKHQQIGSVSAMVTYSAVDVDGNVVRSLENRLSWFLTKIGGRWLVAHEHTSVPVSFESKTALLRRS
jgi:uncharacterized protein (TIGR02246 family)